MKDIVMAGPGNKSVEKSAAKKRKSDVLGVTSQSTPARSADSSTVASPSPSPPKRPKSKGKSKEVPIEVPTASTSSAPTTSVAPVIPTTAPALPAVATPVAPVVQATVVEQLGLNGQRVANVVDQLPDISFMTVRLSSDARNIWTPIWVVLGDTTASNNQVALMVDRLRLRTGGSTRGRGTGRGGFASGRGGRGRGSGEGYNA